MEAKKLLLFPAILLLCLAPLLAQPQLVGELAIDSVQGYIIQMHLDVTNTGDETFSYTFPDSETHFFSIDGFEYHDMFIPVILPWTLAPGATQSFGMINFNPLSSGPHIIHAFLNISPPMQLGSPQTVIIGDTIPVTIGTGDVLTRIPIDFYWRTTLYECIFSAEELDHTSGWITAITFYNNFIGEAFLGQEIRIYLASVIQSDLSEDWLSWEELVPVFYGTVDFPLGANEITIPLDSGIYYNGSENLGLVVHRPIPSSYQMGPESFLAQAADPLRSRVVVSDSQTFYPMGPPDPLPSQHIGYMPKTTFHIIPDTTPVIDEQASPPLLNTFIYPNPTTQSCTIKTSSPVPVSASLEIYNLRGQKVRSFQSTAKSSEHQFFWDCQSDQGELSPSGVYLLRICSGAGALSTKKLVVCH